MADFLRTYVPDHPGPIIRATDGRVLGRHRGLHYFTIGQRKGIGIPPTPTTRPTSSSASAPKTMRCSSPSTAPTAPGLWTSECRVHSLSFISEPITTPAQLECRVRYRDPRVAIEFIPDVGRALRTPPSNEGVCADIPPFPSTATIRFSTPQRALASGQILALYTGERLLGGGVFA
jgi:tRNA-specific 2-thiouridylase